MNPNKQSTGLDIKVKLSMLWIFILFNMAYADIISLMDPASPIRKIMNGAPMPPGGLLVGAILMETAIAMVILSRVLSYKINRLVSIIIAVINILAVITGGQGLYYWFFAAVEVVSMLLIIWFAWKWPKPQEDKGGE
jgi:hypothetical protein